MFYLMWKEKVGFRETLELIKSIRSIASPNAAFISQMIEWENRLKGKLSFPVVYKISGQSKQQPNFLVPKKVTKPNLEMLTKDSVLLILSPQTLWVWKGKESSERMKESALENVECMKRFEALSQQIVFVEDLEDNNAKELVHVLPSTQSKSLNGNNTSSSITSLSLPNFKKEVEANKTSEVKNPVANVSKSADPKIPKLLFSIPKQQNEPKLESQKDVEESEDSSGDSTSEDTSNTDSPKTPKTPKASKALKISPKNLLSKNDNGSNAKEKTISPSPSSPPRFTLPLPQLKIPTLQNSENDLNQTKAQKSPTKEQISPKQSPQKSPKNSPKNFPKNSPKIPLQSPKNSPKLSSPKNSPNTSPRKAPTDSPRKSPTNSPIESPKKPPTESPNRTEIGSPKKTAAESPKHKFGSKSASASPTKTPREGSTSTTPSNGMETPEKSPNIPSHAFIIEDEFDRETFTTKESFLTPGKSNKLHKMFLSSNNIERTSNSRVPSKPPRPSSKSDSSVDTSMDSNSKKRKKQKNGEKKTEKKVLKKVNSEKRVRKSIASFMEEKTPVKGEKASVVEMKESEWQKMPLNCLMEVFSYLSPADLYCVSMCCKKWEDAATRDYVWRRHVASNWIFQKGMKRWKELYVNWIREQAHYFLTTGKLPGVWNDANFSWKVNLFFAGHSNSHYSKVWQHFFSENLVGYDFVQPSERTLAHTCVRSDIPIVSREVLFSEKLKKVKFSAYETFDVCMKEEYILSNTQLQSLEVHVSYADVLLMCYDTSNVDTLNFISSKFASVIQHKISKNGKVILVGICNTKEEVDSDKKVKTWQSEAFCQRWSLPHVLVNLHQAEENVEKLFEMAVDLVFTRVPASLPTESDISRVTGRNPPKDYKLNPYAISEKQHQCILL